MDLVGGRSSFDNEINTKEKHLVGGTRFEEREHTLEGRGFKTVKIRGTRKNYYTPNV